MSQVSHLVFFFFNDTATTEIYTLSLHDALPIFIDKLARQGNPKAYHFSEPHIAGLDYSFSGLKTSFLYNMKKWTTDDPDFIEKHKTDIAASLEHTIVEILMKKLRMEIGSASCRERV